MLYRVVLLTFIALAANHASAEDFYISPTGDDANPGNPEKPFATLSRARDSVRQLTAKGLQTDVTVHVHGGTYRVNEPVVFGPQDGGDDRFRVTYAACQGETPVISGGRAITGWQVRSDGLWTARIPEVRSGEWAFRELFVSGARATRARHPNAGFLRVEKVGADRRTNFQYRDGDLDKYADVESIELVFLHDWSISRVPLKSIDPATRTLTVQHKIGGPGTWTAMDWFEKQPRYYLENATEFVDSPGEWFLDRKSGVVTYCPRDGESPANVEVVAPISSRMFWVSGDTATGDLVKNLHFVGLTVEHAAWAPVDGVYWGRQACTYWSPRTAEDAHEEADPAAVQFELAQSCSFRDGGVQHVGASGIWLGRGCRDCRVEGNLISDTGGNGVMVGEGQRRTVGDDPWWQNAPQQAAIGNTVANNVVRQCGQELFGAVGVWVGLAAKTSVIHNEICEHPYTGVSVGWMWWNPTSRAEPRETPCRQTLVANNHIHHVMQALSDGGGIYSLGNQPESALRGNWIHDVPANVGRAESNGMFLDQGTGDFVIEENLIYNIDRSPLRFHKGWMNVVRNNTLAVHPGVEPVRYNDTKKERITLVDNTIVESVPAAVIEEASQRAGLESSYREKLLPSP